MPYQVPLNFPKTLSYGRENYVRHQGVVEILRVLQEASNSPIKKPFIVEAESRFGKTHLLVSLQEIFEREGKKTVFLTFDDLINFQQTIDWHELLAHCDSLLIDDFDLFLDESLRWGDLGKIVNLFEFAKQNDLYLVLTSTKGITTYDDVDPHVKSRLNLLTWLNISKPAEDEIPELLKVLAKQRGMKLSDRQIQFLCKRLRQDICSIESYLNRLQNWSEVAGEPIRLQNISNAL